jgi:hypothetical protein
MVRDEENRSIVLARHRVLPSPRSAPAQMPGFRAGLRAGSRGS